MANQIEQLLTVVDAFCEARGISEARASTLIFNGGGRVKQLREGRDIGVLTSLSAMRWLSEHWPDDSEWPADIPRPTPLSAFPAVADTCCHS